MRNIVLFATALIISAHVFSQEPVDYEHRIVEKMLKKEWSAQVRMEQIMEHDTVQDGRFFQVVTPAQEVKGYAYIGRVFSCRTKGCGQNGANTVHTNYEYFDYGMMFTHEPTVQRVRVFNYQATHGHEITSRGWLRQFSNYSGQQKLRVGKEVDAITGATISAHAISRDIRNITKHLREYLSAKEALQR